MSCNHYIWNRDGLCYFCRKKIRWKDVILADGCTVPACGECFTGIENGKKIAEERGLYDPNKTRGGDRMKVEKGSTGGNNLKVDFVIEKKITSLKITDEGEMVTYQPKTESEKPSTKLVIGVNYDGKKDGDPDKWSLNNKSRNALIDIWGDDTSDWVGKTAEISISGEGEYKHIVVDTLRTK